MGDLSLKYRIWLPFILGLISSVVSQSQRREEIEGRDPRAYTNFEILDPERNYAVEWVVNWNERRILFKVEVRTKGYVAFGLSSDGRMAGADIVIGGVLPNGAAYFSDRYGVDHVEPLVDQSQDWVLHEAEENQTHTILSFSRGFRNCDQDDYQINEYDVTKLVWACGLTDNPSESHRSEYSGSYPVYLLDPNLVPRSIKESSFKRGPPSCRTLAENNLRVWTVSTRYRVTSRRDTIYYCNMHKGPRLPKKHHIVGYEVRLESEVDVKHVHHLLLYRCTPPQGSDASQFFQQFVGSRGEDCFFLARPSGRLPTQHCTHITGAWAIGGRITFYPDHVGLPFGYNPDEYYLFQVHYDNAELTPSVDVTVHMDFFYTSQLRPNELGLMTIGHHIPGSPSVLIPPDSPAHNIYGHCGGECTGTMLPPEGINVFALILHTHYAGRRIRFRHFRQGRELPWLAEDSNYESTYQAYRQLKTEVNIRPGDHLMARCEYDNTWTNGTTVGGFGTSQEMCTVYIMYYNRLDGYSLCRSEIVDDYYMRHYLGVNNITWDDAKLDYVATSPRRLAGLSMAEISNGVSWTDQLRNELQQDHINLPQANACSGSPFSSTGGGQVGDEGEPPTVVNFPRVTSEYVPPPPPETCTINSSLRHMAAINNYYGW